MKTPFILFGVLVCTTCILAGCVTTQPVGSENTVPPLLPVNSPNSTIPTFKITTSPNPTNNTSLKGKTPMKATIAQIKTQKGVIEIQLLPDKAPNTVSNFIQKATSGFYKNLTFHRVEDWVVQGGDPVGNGTGGGSMPTELNQEPFLAGSVGVARGGDIKISNDSQFFICTTDCRWLDGQYTNFGKVIKGMDVVKQISIGDSILDITTK